MNRTLIYNIPSAYDGYKISAFLKDMNYPSGILTLFRHTPDTVLLNDKPVFLNTILCTGDRLTVFVKETASGNSELHAVRLPFHVVYEDEDLVVINKPANMPIHPSLRHYEDTLANAAAYYYRDETSPFIYRCINRLDKNTSGLTILAKNPLSGHLLQAQMRERTISRTYTALVEGSFASPSGTVDLPIGRVDNSIILRHVDFANGESAVTHYQVLRSNGNFSLLSLQLDTGRTHQIRVHMSAIGHPLVGDYLYNPGFDASVFPRHALHAGALEFSHPVTGEAIHLQVDLPEDMQELITTLQI